jgi:uncharacterized protein
MTSMLHTLSSTFTTCACGMNAKGCALNRLADFVDSQTPPTPSPSPPSSRDDSRMDGILPPASRKARKPTFLGPLIGVQRGFRTRERVPMSGGMSGVEMDTYHESLSLSAFLSRQPEAGPSNITSPNGVQLTTSGSSTDSSQLEGSHPESSRNYDRKGKRRVVDDEVEMDLEISPAARRNISSRYAKGESITSIMTLYKDLTNLPDTVEKTLQISVAQFTSSAGSTTHSSPLPDTIEDSDPPLVPVRLGEAKLPPKLRKRWIQKNSEALKETTQLNTPSYLAPNVENAYPDDFRERMDTNITKNGVLYSRVYHSCLILRLILRCSSYASTAITLVDHLFYTISVYQQHPCPCAAASRHSFSYHILR